MYTKPKPPPEFVSWMFYPSLRKNHIVPGKGEKVFHSASLCGHNPRWNGWIPANPSKPNCVVCEKTLQFQLAYQLKKDALKKDKKALRHKKRKFRMGRYTRGAMKLLMEYGPMNTRQIAETLGCNGHTALESCYFLAKSGRIKLISPGTRGSFAVPPVYGVVEISPGNVAMTPIQ